MTVSDRGVDRERDCDCDCDNDSDSDSDPGLQTFKKFKKKEVWSRERRSWLAAVVVVLGPMVVVACLVGHGGVRAD